MSVDLVSLDWVWENWLGEFSIVSLIEWIWFGIFIFGSVNLILYISKILLSRFNCVDLVFDLIDLVLSTRYYFVLVNLLWYIWFGKLVFVSR